MVHQLDWITQILLAKYPDGVAPRYLEDALGQNLPPVFPSGGTVVKLANSAESDYRLTLSDGRAFDFYYRHWMGAGSTLSVGFFFETSNADFHCFWGVDRTDWICIRR